jgi:glycosyltransferase involved in cell wall biosynthesis
MPSTKERSSQPEVILSANVSHYYYTALALYRASYLKRYICAIGLTHQNPWFSKALPRRWQKKLQGRDISGVDPRLVRCIWVAEILQRALPGLGLISRDRGDWLNNYIYDILAKPWVDSCDIFHFVSSVGLYSARKAKAAGSLVLCDIRTEYPDYQFRILAEEYSRLGLPYNPPGLLYDGKVKAEYALADYLIVPSLYAKRTFVEAGYDERTVLVLPYGVDLEHFFVAAREGETGDAIQVSGTHSDRFRIVYVGQVVPRKGVHYLIEAFNTLDKSSMELLLIGRVDETMSPLVNRAAECNAKIRIVGELPKKELYRLYNSAAVLVLPSLADSWGLVVLEAMACGVPVIVSENTGSAEAIQEGVNGYVVPIRNPEALQEKLIYLYEHPEMRQEMGLAARCSAMDFSWERYGQRLLSLYDGILSNRGIGVSRSRHGLSSDNP